MFPETRMRRIRRTAAMRMLSQETAFDCHKMILPLFVVPGENREEPVASMPGVSRNSVDLLIRRVETLRVKAVLLFGVPDPEEKDAVGSAAIGDNSLISHAVRAIKAVRPDLIAITDVCLCGYTNHGHCGVLTESQEVDNDRTLDILARMAQVHAIAGADMVAPSAMMDGQVKAIRERLDGSGFSNTAVMSYAAKFASAFYGPFRDAAASAPAFGDRRAYQLPPANRREAVREALLDEAEGADWLMVKPALPYLDILAEIRRACHIPIAAYQVSGEYAMIKIAAAAGAFAERAAVFEAITAIRRAGADAVITYYAEEICRWAEHS